MEGIHDFLSQDIREALYHVSVIMEKISTVYILDNNFCRFCKSDLKIEYPHLKQIFTTMYHLTANHV